MIDFPSDALRTSASAEHSRYVQRIRRRYASDIESAILPSDRVPRSAEIAAAINSLQDRGRELGAALRVARQLVLERLATLDVEAGAPLLDITGSMTELAEVTLDRALAAAEAEADTRFGAPLNAAGERVDLWIVGMGKLGGRELNVSSDIDLIYVYEDDGMTTGVDDGRGGLTGQITVHEYFSHVVKRLYALIGDTTEDGFVFRVDLALRPNGNSGPSVVSLAMLEEYFLVQGREWERFAWLKSRIVAPARAMPGGAHAPRSLALRDIVMPFVFRRYLDYGVFEGLRQLHRKIRDEANRRAAGRPERANDVKLSRGGIREIEFTVQLLQVVRGGQFPEIRTRSTLRALQRLAARGLIPAETADQLAQAYVALRRIEHRIQYLDDQQTHLLPTDDKDLAWIAASLGLQGLPERDSDCQSATCQLLDLLCSIRELVATEFDSLLHDGRAPTSGDGCKNCGGPPLPVDSDEFIAKFPEPIANKLREFVGQSRVGMLSDPAKLRLAKLIGRATKVALTPAKEGCTDCLGPDAVLHFIDWLNPLLRRDSYLSLLAERPEVLTRLLRLLGLARWPMRYLMLHPGVIDELADPRLMDGRFDPRAYRQDLEARHRAWERAGQASEEALLDTLRRAHHAEVFRTLVRDVEGLITVEQVADDLSALADVTLEVALRWAWHHLQQRPVKQGAWAVGRDPHFAIIAYGKLGGKELGYGSDLDVVFVYDDSQDRPDPNAGPDTPTAIDAYMLFARKLITWLTLRTSVGELFDIDTALRPNGNSGLLVTSFHAFDDYQRQRGSNTAWTWEHQALTRARWCAGEPALADQFETVRRAVLSSPRDPVALRDEVVFMREKMRQAQACPPDHFDIKHSTGGMIDVEFAVQYLILAHSQRHPDMMDNLGNIALLTRAEQAGLLPSGVGQAAGNAYRTLRQLQHRARLNDAPTQLQGEALTQINPHREAVLTLWRTVFESPAPAA
ncbi:MAG: bifunctional [glutamate--ammonia ligase]-adenylyl-L-tyrosine phosphorylase/[glutamate--ammonia-ligase] adenylyltransferase [Burkholderiales bacterium]|nr:bifunctional [glutamate--ammonia ligase]-adenylyl-L-tyrosine phosphorylase/[glutamate--ammonia-ligase] adenylyltransferase [Burkholderiales bacterium]